MTSVSYLSWDNFRSTVLVAGQQRIHRMTESPRIEVFGDGVANRVGAVIEVDQGTPIPPELSSLASITARLFEDDSRWYLEIATAAPTLHRQFYHYLLAVAERVVEERLPPAKAVAMELQSFSDLLEERALLGLERQIGLLGELLLLERFAVKEGSGALDAWLGPLGEPHDFRVGTVEFEVKTTVQPRRVHTIHGTEQLIASSGCDLYLISVLLGPAGTGPGFTLGETVARISESLRQSPDQLNDFLRALAACGFREADSAYYTGRYAMRRPLGIVPVTGTFPAITRSTILDALGSGAARIESITYEVNVEGLEHEDGTPEFEAVLGPESLSHD